MRSEEDPGIVQKRIAVVKVRVHQDEHGRWCADSDDVFGLFLWEETRSELLREIPAAITKLYSLNHDIEVAVSPAWTSDLLTAAAPQQVSAVKRRLPVAYVLETEAAR